MRTRRSKACEKEIRGQRIEFRLWRRWRRERLNALLAGPYGEATKALLDFIKTMPGPNALIDFVKAGPWSDADADIRFEILALVDAVIVKRRQQMGKTPFDDSIPWSGKPPNAFLTLRVQLLGEEFFA
jgi:hypothetical protein